MPLVAGSKLGPYEIVSPLGAGGMGEVYRARDKRLDRDVALKVLPEAFANDAQRMLRFEREAKVLASLNHPNIAVLYGVEESKGARALVMELVEGLTLAERIKRGPVALDEALPIAKQMAEALEYAHERSIIHRDLKPSNVKLTADGQVKLLDFGLAKALEGETNEEELQNSPTLSAAATRAGVMLGTAAYMAPEQARGKRVDRRADIWAFGCVLYEMLTGRDAFGGETTSDILACVIRAEPDWSLLHAAVPPRIRELVRRCLQKDPRQRLQAIGEARIALNATIAGASDEPDTLARTTTQPLPPLYRALPWAVASLATTLAIAIGALYWRAKQPEAHQVVQASMLLPEPLAGVFSPNPGSPFALSQDGSRIVFVGSPEGKPQQLYVRELDQETATPIPGTENATQPFFSPDGEWIGFFADGKMRKVQRGGGPVTILGDAPIPHGASWASEDTIVYAPNLGSGLMRISSAGGTPQVLTTPDAKQQELSHRWPQLLPGNTVLFTIQTTTQITYDDARIALLSLETGKWRTLFEGGSYARYVPSGHIVYAHAGALMAVPFDLARLQVRGSPVPVQQGVVTTVATSGGAEYDVANTGLLAYVPGSTRPPERSLVWVDRQGVSKELTAPVNSYVTPRISPDGKMLAVQIFNAGGEDLWIYDFSRNTLMRLTFSGGGGSAAPLWTPDSRKVIYRSRVPTLTFRAKSPDGSGAEETLFSKELEDPSATPFTVSPDGKTLLFGCNVTGAVGIYAISLDGSAKVQAFLQSTFNQSSPRFSPDGHWVVYSSNESGRGEVYVQPYPGPGGKWLISTEGGEYPLWARSGREIFFRSEDKIIVVPVETQPTFKAGTPRMLFRGGNYVMLQNYDVAPDGQHFLMIKEKEAPASSKEVRIVLHWTDELKRIVPSGKK
jgi:serine/threonine protein kinase